MPDSYTHVNTAIQALLWGKQAVASLPCYIAGANGPDPFTMYQFWRRRRQPDLAALADRIHREKTGQFLRTLLDLSVTPEQQSYAMGFLTHYTTDCTLHPYISALGDAGVYHGRKERIRFETSIDSALFYKNYRTRTVPLYAATPMLLTDDLGQVAQLLRDAIGATYEVDIPIVSLTDAFHDNVKMRKYMISPHGGKKAWASLTAPMRTGGKNAAPMLCRMQPGKPLPRLPETWKNPYTGEELHLSFDEVTLLAEQTGAAMITAAMSYWLGEIDGDKMAAILGDNNYYTGRPNPPPGQPARVVPMPGAAKQAPQGPNPAAAKAPVLAATATAKPADTTKASAPISKAAPAQTGATPASAATSVKTASEPSKTFTAKTPKPPMPAPVKAAAPPKPAPAMAPDATPSAKKTGDSPASTAAPLKAAGKPLTAAAPPVTAKGSPSATIPTSTQAEETQKKPVTPARKTVASTGAAPAKAAPATTPAAVETASPLPPASPKKAAAPMPVPLRPTAPPTTLPPIPGAVPVQPAAAWQAAQPPAAGSTPHWQPIATQGAYMAPPATTPPDLEHLPKVTVPTESE